MESFTRSAVAGAAGALTTNVTHEVVRRMTPDAPRVDLLGMQGLARIMQTAGVPPLRGNALYCTTLAFDLLSNGAMFALAARAPKPLSFGAGVAIGLLAGLGAAYLPQPLGFSDTTGRTPATRALTIALYTAGGAVAGATAATL